MLNLCKEGVKCLVSPLGGVGIGSCRSFEELVGVAIGVVPKEVVDVAALPNNGWRMSPCGWSVPRKRDINVGKDKVWLSRTVRIKDSRFQVDTFQLPRLARRCNEDRQMEDGLLCAIYRT